MYYLHILAPVFSYPRNYELSACDEQPILVIPLAIDNCDGQVIVTAVHSDDFELNTTFTKAGVDCGNRIPDMNEVQMFSISSNTINYLNEHGEDTV